MRALNGEDLDVERTVLGWSDSSSRHYRGACAQMLNEAWGKTMNIAAPESGCSKDKSYRDAMGVAGSEWTRASHTSLHRQLVC